MLTKSGLSPFAEYAPHDLAVYNPITHQPSPYSVQHQLQANPSPQNSLLGNEGKIVSGKDRLGNEWTITVHGPGTAIITDTSPNDGVLNDSIDTIQLIGTNINTTYVTGSVVASFRTQSDSTVSFNRLVDTSGVRSVILNGFNLTQTVIPVAGTPNNLNTGVFLTGGVRYLQFNDINAPVDTSNSDAAVNVVIGDPSTPIKVQPVIRLGSINTTVYDSTATAPPSLVPVTTPSVNIVVNGQIKSLDFVSTTQDIAGIITAQGIPPRAAAAQAYLYPIISTTGRTSVQTIGIGNLNVSGGATNFTASRSAVPFQNGFSGLSKLKNAHFRGPTDAVGLDVNGKIGTLRYEKGISNNNNLFLGTTSTGPQIPASLYGTPTSDTSYAGAGLIGGEVTAKKIGSLLVLPSNSVNQVPSNPDFSMLNGPGTITYIPHPGTAIANGLITSSGNIGHTKIVGDSYNTEIKSGFSYSSYAAGLEGTRAPSRIAPVKITGQLVNSVVSATYRPASHYYGTPIDVRGPGKIRGNFVGSIFSNNGVTTLGNVGSGFYARTKVGYLPPPQSPKRVNGVLKRG